MSPSQKDDDGQETTMPVNLEWTKVWNNHYGWELRCGRDSYRFALPPDIIDRILADGLAQARADKLLALLTRCRNEGELPDELMEAIDNLIPREIPEVPKYESGILEGETGCVLVIPTNQEEQSERRRCNCVPLEIANQWRVGPWHRKTCPSFQEEQR